NWDWAAKSSSVEIQRAGLTGRLTAARPALPTSSSGSFPGFGRKAFRHKRLTRCWSTIPHVLSRFVTIENRQTSFRRHCLVRSSHSRYRYWNKLSQGGRRRPRWKLLHIGDTVIQLHHAGAPPGRAES